MRYIALISLILISITVLTNNTSSAEANSDIPSGVSVSDWIPMGDSFGFVIVQTINKPKSEHIIEQRKQPDGSIRGLFTMGRFGELSGYFMIKKQDGWYKLTEEKEAKAYKIK